MDYDCLELDNIIGFDWDNGNILKNEMKHGLKWQEIEEVFFNEPLVLLKDCKHSSKKERRCLALGHIDSGDQISVIFTIRVDKIRVISARAMSKKERRFYEESTKF